jgi:hypothetical protein
MAAKVIILDTAFPAVVAASGFAAGLGIKMRAMGVRGVAAAEDSCVAKWVWCQKTGKLCRCAPGQPLAAVLPTTLLRSHARSQQSWRHDCPPGHRWGLSGAPGRGTAVVGAHQLVK